MRLLMSDTSPIVTSMEIDESRLIFCAGAPGSTWSRIIKQLSRFPSVDNSDWNEARNYNNYAHFGNYFGPAMEFGNDFHRVAELAPGREDFLRELAKPYATDFSDRFRLLKSHAFAYSLAFIRRLLPASRLLFIWRSNDECFKWWMQAGGFSITYPNYSWYENVYRMKRQISIENQCILNYAQEAVVSLEPMSVRQIASRLTLVALDDYMFPDDDVPVPNVLISIT